MKRGTAAVVVLAAAVAVVLGLLAKDRFEAHEDRKAEDAAESVVFQGKRLDVPAHWHVYGPGTRGGVLQLTGVDAGGLAPTLTLTDERQKPEIPAQFVAGWKDAQRLPGFQPRSVEQYDDAAVDAAAMPCVAIDWGATRRPLQMVCLSSDGRWKLTLLGVFGDVPGLDAMARQIPDFERGL